MDDGSAILFMDQSPRRPAPACQSNMRTAPLAVEDPRQDDLFAAHLPTKGALVFYCRIHGSEGHGGELYVP